MALSYKARRRWSLVVLLLFMPLYIVIAAAIMSRASTWFIDMGQLGESCNSSSMLYWVSRGFSHSRASLWGSAKRTLTQTANEKSAQEALFI